MTLQNEGLNRIRTLLANDIDKGQVGTGTALPTPSDGGLLGTATALLAVESVTANTDKTVNIQYTVPSTQGNGLSITEMEIQLSNGDSLFRKLHEAINKDNTKEIRYFTSTFITQRK